MFSLISQLWEKGSNPLLIRKRLMGLVESFLLFLTRFLILLGDKLDTIRSFSGEEHMPEFCHTWSKMYDFWRLPSLISSFPLRSSDFILFYNSIYFRFFWIFLLLLLPSLSSPALIVTVRQTQACIGSVNFSSSLYSLSWHACCYFNEKYFILVEHLSVLIFETTYFLRFYPFLCVSCTLCRSSP